MLSLCVSLAACSSKSKAGTGSVASSKPVSSSSSAVSSSSAGASSSSAPQKVYVSVTIPEGYSVPQIAKKLAANNVCSVSDFISAVNTYQFTEESAGQSPYSSGKICFRLEGYLYPSTYELYENMPAQDVIGKMLAAADSRIIAKGYDFQTVILASIIQREAPDLDTMEKVSSVLHNRLKDTKDYPYLGSDATVMYLTNSFDIPYIDKTLGTDLVDQYKAYYNTDRRVKGLPAGPICNPGADALYAAANPADTTYKNFYTDSSGYHFS